MRDRLIRAGSNLLCLFAVITLALPKIPIAASDIRYPALDNELDYYEARFPSGLRYVPGWYGTFQFAPEAEEILLYDDLMEFNPYQQEWFGRTLFSMKPGSVPRGEEGGTSIRKLTVEETRTILQSYPPDIFKPFEPEIEEVIQPSTLWTQPHAGDRVEQRWRLVAANHTLEIVERQDGYYELVEDYERELDGDVTEKPVKIPVKLTEKQQSYLESVRKKEAAAPKVLLNLDKFDPPRYWVNNGGNWNDTNHWANASGNMSAGASRPTNADQVFFDSNSFSAANQTVTVDMASQCLDLNWTQVTNNPTLHHAASLSFFRNAEFSQNMTVTNTGTYSLTVRGASCTLKTNGLILRAVWVESGGLTLLDDTTLSSTFTVWRGNLTTNSHTLTASSVSLGASSSYSEIINLGSSNISTNGLASAYGLFTPNTAVINVLGKGSLNANASFNGTTIRLAGDGTHTITGTFTVDTLSLAPPGFVQVVKVTSGTNITVNRLIKEGNGYSLIDSSGNWSITDADGGANTLNNIQISGSRAYPDDSFTADIHTVDNGNNTGWEFLTPAPPVSVKNDVLLLLSNGAGDYGARITNIAGSLENWGLNVDIIENSNEFELIEDGNDWYLDNHAGSVIHLVKNQEMLYKTILFGLTSSEAIYGKIEGDERRVKKLLESYPFIVATKRPTSFTSSNNHSVWQINRNNIGTVSNTITMANPLNMKSLETFKGWKSTLTGTNNYVNRNTTVTMLEVFDSGNSAIAVAEYRSGGKALTIAFSDWGYAVHRAIFVSLLLEYTEAPYKIPYYSYEVDDVGGPATENHEYIDFIEWTLNNLGGYPTLAVMGKYLDDNPPPNIRAWGQNPDKYYVGDDFNPDLPLLIDDLKECPEYVIASHSYNHDRDLWMYTATGLPVDGFADDDEDGLLNWEDDDLLGAGINNNYNPDLDMFSGGALADYNLAQQTLAFSREREIYNSLGLDFYKVLITPKFVHLDGYVNTLAAQYGFTVLSGHIGHYMGYYMTGGYVNGTFVPGRVAPSDSPQNPDIPLEGTSLTNYVNQFRAYTGLRPLVLITTHVPHMRQGETPEYEARDSALDAWLRLNTAGFRLLSTQSATNKHIGWLWTTMDSISAGSSQMELALDSATFEDGTGRKELGIVLPHSIQSAKTGELYNIYIDDNYLYFGKQSGISEVVDITFGSYDTFIPRLAYVSTPATDVLKSVFDPSMEAIHITLYGYFDTEIKIENCKPGTEYAIADITANTPASLFTTDGFGVLTATLQLGGEHEFTISEPLNPTNAALSLVKTGAWVDGDGDGVADAGEAINYTFAVTNEGNVALTNVTVVDTVGGVTVSGGPTTLEVGETDNTTFTGVYYITRDDIDAGHFFNTATADSDESGPADGTADVTLPGNAALSLVKTGAWVDGDGDGVADAGEAINYTFAVTNEGNVILTNVTVVDTVGGVTVSGGPTTLEVGETDNTTFTGVYYITRDDIDAGHFFNTATADSDESGPADGNADVTLPSSNIKEPVVLISYPDSKAIDCVYGNVMKAQTIIPANAFALDSIRFQLRKSGSPSGNVEMSIKATDSEGKPVGDVLASSSLPCATVTDSIQWHSFSFNDDITLDAGKQYAICLSLPQGDSSNRIWYQVHTANSYPSGCICQTYSAGIAWKILENYDAAFEVIG